jgi:hypothetical protein
MPSEALRARCCALAALLVSVVVASGCSGGPFKPEYE